ncbi:NPCBM/NEW2 domain-containing protein [Fibrobacter intestinalis]|uniref:NPCBM/NEW2 domain-containing protein n=1 Tax=Fibrobacter intestinalis TaxID=28122 RepID=UPI0023F03A29|nr:NPCBM/NEW2 domain-containing protein [Fibrobacter intestinalis]MDD7299395.1 NPCBM/NEW2 domain-containing protein [Fibrobacter intestinalis]
MYKYRDNLRLFLFWGVICAVANILCTFASAFESDQGYWVGWIKKLMEEGFAGFDGNYPPLYVFWLWVVAQVYSLFDMAVDKNLFLKFTCLWPVFFAHLFLVDWVCRLLGKFNYPDWKKHLMVGFAALNPALLLNGPIWGQVDLFPSVIAVMAIYCINRPRLIFLASMFYVLALLTKFQMIAFLPVFGGLFIRNWKTSWKGLPLAVLALVLVLLPFAVGGNLQGMLTRAYVQTTSQYAYATFNAANIWILLAGNVSPDNVPIWEVSEYGLGFLLKPVHLGKILFVIVSILVLVKSVLCRNIRTAFALCTLNALAFFMLLPQMHERYLLYAVPMALCWLVWDMQRGGILCLAVTAVAAVNINLLNTFRGDYVWKMDAYAGCIALLVGILLVLCPRLLEKLVHKVSSLRLPAFVPYGVLLLILTVVSGFLAFQSRPIAAPKGDGYMLVTDLPMESSVQRFRSPRINQSVDGHLLTVDNRVYINGIGTHAPSTITYTLPEEADSLFLGVGIDGECHENGQATFIVKLDGDVVWRRSRVRGAQKPYFASISVQGANVLELRTDPEGSDHCDHTDWLNAYVKLR